MKEELVFSYEVPEKGKFGFYVEYVETGKESKTITGFFLNDQEKEGGDKIYLNSKVAFLMLNQTLQGSSYIASLQINPEVLLK